MGCVWQRLEYFNESLKLGWKTLEKSSKSAYKEFLAVFQLSLNDA